MEQLALYGGPKTKNTPFETGMRFGEEELNNLRDALAQNTLFYWYGHQVKHLTERFAQMYEMPYCVAASSGTAAIHVALGACGVTAGDEVITSPITDMGTVIGILYQNAIPVFADLDPNSYNLDPRSVESKITDKTKVILVVHLTGGPADMDGIMAVAKKHNLKVIEDCAQSYLTHYKGRLCGTIGDVGCFSLNDFKQISAGDGGLLIMRDRTLYETSLRFADKNYQRLNTAQANRDVPFIAPNYRMNELTGAVGLAQLTRLPHICARRTEIGEKISAGIRDLPGIYPPKVYEGGKSTYWFYMFRVDEKAAGVSRDLFSDALEAEGLQNQRGYIPCCIYEYEMFVKKTGYRQTGCPFNCRYNGHEHHYGKGLCPVAEEILSTAIRLPVSEFYSDADVDAIIAAIKKVSAYFKNGSK
jgi:dTDP-4-amino-4,6-dideoxygalactose transaminase